MATARTLAMAGISKIMLTAKTRKPSYTLPPCEATMSRIRAVFASLVGSSSTPGGIATLATTSPTGASKVAAAAGQGTSARAASGPSGRIPPGSSARFADAASFPALIDDHPLRHAHRYAAVPAEVPPAVGTSPMPVTDPAAAWRGAGAAVAMSRTSASVTTGAPTS